MAAEVTDPHRAGRRFRTLLVSRVVEQGVLGAASLLLAAYLGPQAFAPIAILFIVNSGAVTLSDFGVGLAALRCPPDQHIGTGARRRMRLINLSLLAAGLAAAVVVRGEIGLFIGSSVAIWWSSAEAFVQKASAINRGFGTRSAVSELLGITAFVVVIAVGVAMSDVFVGVAAGFVVKHLVEWIVARHPRDVFSSRGAVFDLKELWVSQALAYTIANVDYAIVGIVLGASRAVGVYDRVSDRGRGSGDGRVRGLTHGRGGLLGIG